MHSINLHDIGHYFEMNGQRISLFKELNLSITSGQSYAIVGPSGAGKSSLLTLMAGLETPKTGRSEFIFAGKQSDQMTLRRNSGFIFQQFHLLPELDALGNIALPLKLKGDKQALQKAEEGLEKVALLDRAHHKPNQLSGGEQQRVAIARAFINQPAFIFADEPTGNLDETTAEQVCDLLFDFSRTHLSTLVIVTHNRQLASRADHVFQLSKGQLEKLQ